MFSNSILFQGARLVHGGKRLGTKGYFIEPTIFADCTEDMTIIKEEIFGPVCVHVCMYITYPTHRS